MRAVVANVLTVGVADKSGILEELPIRLLVMDTGTEAVRCLRSERIDTVVSRWELADMPDGLLLRKLIAAKPAIPTIAFISPGDYSQEIAARGLGVSAILSEDVDDEYFREVLCELLGICTVVSVKATNEQHSAEFGSDIEKLRIL